MIPFAWQGPFGLFTPDEKQRNIILLAGGIGVTPFHSFILHAAARGLHCRTTLFYSSKTPGDAAFLPELLDAARKNTNIKIIATVTRPDGAKWQGLTGRIDEAMIRKFSGIENAVFYVCGPPAMVDSMKEIASRLAPEERIHTERFFGY